MATLCTASNKFSAVWLQGEAACIAVTHSDVSVMSRAAGHGALAQSFSCRCALFEKKAAGAMSLYQNESLK